MKRHLSVSCVLAFVVALASIGSERSAAQTNGGVPNFDWDPLFFQDLPNRWTTGQVGGISVDNQDHTWIAHRPASITPTIRTAALTPPAARCCTPAPPIIEFDQNGRFVRAFGGAADGYEWPTTEHGIYADHRGDIWIAGNGKGDNHILKFTNTGKFLLQIGRRGQSKGSSDRANVYGAAAMVVFPKTNELFVADGYTNRRVIVFDADTGAFKRTWGAFGKPPGGKDNCAIARVAEFPPGDGLPDFNVAHSIRVSNDGTVYLADRENRRVQMFTSDGKFVKQLRQTAEPFATNLAFSPDRDQQFLYVGGGKAITIIDRKTFDVLGRVQVEKQLGGGHHIATDSKGNLYIAQTTAGMQRLLFKGLSGPAVR